MSSEMKTEDTAASEEGKPPKKKGAKRQRQSGPMTRLRRSVSQRDPMAVLVFEQRLLVAATIGVLIALILWIVAVSTDYWFHVTASGGAVYQNSTKSYFVRSNSGLWTICKYIIYNDTNGPIVRICHNHRLFPTLAQIADNPEIDRTILDYTRTETAFAIITFCLVFMGLGFSIYTFKEQRYMFKRLAGGVHFITAAAILVVIEVVVNSVQYEEQFLNARHPKSTVWSYGYSFIIACFTFIIMLLAGAIFLICSRKRKGDRATGLGAGDDEPNILGRM